MIALVYKCSQCSARYTVSTEGKLPIDTTDKKYVGGITKEHKKKCKGKLFHVNTLVAR